ncbi:hypothetical protein VOLCADRAFT_105175 [Volvox carteri f. nagariensis]|uniref:Uncharacterized protein n=1 Tax=Volvox carteri f. nagariensis TaxID=3068 RepID=D8TZ20_VOLCA|nr:uncharacterized protein VOLCADRAFT_105175 [Volvox carteri f. nagariensis]EFJ47200.1 hypothetical protein VOLCADRAFT_105175 [Volvox carteri f. nagariensis]|eukprot:XP_002951749.1 hypothetical protein VOLCADRAFT_105175 [Volvox carteri f. nagariensis]
MQFFRAGGQRACSRRQSLCGVVCGSGRTETHEDASGGQKGPTGLMVYPNQWKSREGHILTSSLKSSATCSPLQFIFDDLASPSVQPMWAFRRAVCVPFQPAACSVRAALERKVRMLLLDNRANCRFDDMQAMASLLLQHELRAVIIHPGKPHAGMSLFARSISAPFIVVTSEDTEEVVVVDAALREHLLVAPCTPEYQRTLAATIPDLFIGTLPRLHELISSMASAISRNFASQGIDVPPWRRSTALLGRWATVKEQLCLRKEQLKSWDHLGMGYCTTTVQQLVPDPAVTPCGEEPAAPCGVEGLEAHETAWPEAQVHGDPGATAQHRPFVVVRGFEVCPGGDVPVHVVRERGDRWPNIKPGGLASLCRKQSGGAPGSSTDSDAVLGASPSSVFRSE